MGQNERYLINFTFYETFKDEPIPHTNFTILGQGSHEIPGGDHPTPLLVFDVGTKTLGNRRVKHQQLHRAMHFLSEKLELILTSSD